MDSEEKIRKNYIKVVEKLIRSSVEYTRWANDRRDKTIKCEMCGRDNNNLVPFEVHHTPHTLYDVCDLYIKDLNIMSLEVALDLLEQHLANKISVKVVCTCCHLASHAAKKLQK